MLTLENSLAVEEIEKACEAIKSLQSKIATLAPNDYKELRECSMNLLFWTGYLQGSLTNFLHTEGDGIEILQKIRKLIN